jgi:hypothetical protein
LSAALSRPELSRPTLACIGLCAAVLVFASADLAHTASRVPEIPSYAPRCAKADRECFGQGFRARSASVRQRDRLQDQFDTRSWLYAFGIAGLVAVAVAYSLRSSRRTEWPRVFTNLGVIGVWWAIASTIVLLVTAGDRISVAAGPLSTVPVLLIAAAAVGAWLGRSEGWAHESQVDEVIRHASMLRSVVLHLGTRGASSRSKLEGLARWFSIAALALTGATVVLAVAFSLPQPGCGGGGTPVWTDPVGAAAAVAAVAAVAAGVGALVLRHWVPALFSLVVCPAAFLVMILSTCLD